MVRNWKFWLIFITGVAIFIRSLPAWTNAAWGCDFGIYYGLTNSFVENQALYNTYNGWGDSYQYFPVLYSITGIAHWITGIDLLTLMPKIAPIFGGLSVLLFYFVVYELLNDRKKALLSSLFLAVLPFHVYQTSHASPLTLGHFFMMLSMLFFIRFRKNSKYSVPLLISTMFLIMSHHLTTYFYLISLICIVFVENAVQKEWTATLKKDIIYILIASSCIFSYWIFVATPIYEGFIQSGLQLGPLSISANYAIGLFYCAFFMLFGMVWLKRKLKIFTKAKRPTPIAALMKFLITITIILILMGIFITVKLPWTNFSFTPLSILYSLPLLIIFAFGVAGFRYLRFIKNGAFIKGWIAALLFSLLYGLLTNSRVILPHRHFEYIMVPLSIIAVFGLEAIFLSFKLDHIGKYTKKISSLNKPAVYFFRGKHPIQKRQVLYFLIIIILVTANAVSVYPSHVALNASYEAITNEDVAVIDWIEEHLDKNSSVIASDHRLARIAEAVKFNTTLDEASSIWITDNFVDCIFELEGIGKNYSRITHIVVDDIMKERVVHVGFGKIFYMTNNSYDKFSYQPFDLLYRNATINQELIEEHWAEVYAVNWTYIDRFLKP